MRISTRKGCAFRRCGCIAPGSFQKDVLDLILLNCQVPRERLSDLRAQMAANRVGAALPGIVREVWDGGGVGGRCRIARLRRTQDAHRHRRHAGRDLDLRGCFRKHQVTEHLPLKVRVTIQGDAMSLHFDGKQLRAGLNMTWTALAATAYYVVKSVVDPTILPNAGLARPLTVTAPDGTVLNLLAWPRIRGRVQTTSACPTSFSARWRRRCRSG